MSTERVTLAGKNPVIQMQPGQKVYGAAPVGFRVTGGTSGTKTTASMTTSGIWVEPAPPIVLPSGIPTIPDAPAGWDEVLNTRFPIDVPEGGFTNNGNAAYPWLNPYDLGWKNTANWKNKGIYNPALGSVKDGILRQGCRTINGIPQTFTFGTFPPGCSTRGGYVSGRVEVVIRSNGAKGYKIAFMLWTDAPSDPVYGPDYPKWRDGEIDWLEVDLDVGELIAAYLHYRNVQVSVDSSGHVTPLENPYQEGWRSSSVTLADWIRVACEWVAGQYVAILVNGVEVKRFMTRIPTVSCHFNAQVETALDVSVVDPAVNSSVDLAAIRQWRKAA